MSPARGLACLCTSGEAPCPFARKLSIALRFMPVMYNSVFSPCGIVTLHCSRLHNFEHVLEVLDVIQSARAWLHRA